VSAPLPPISVATAADLGALADIERAATTLFRTIGFDLEAGDSAGAARHVGGGPLVLVAGRPPVGFAQLELVDGSAHLEEVAVHPEWTRRGIGRALVVAAWDWAEASGYRTLTLITYRDVPWNAPFYERLGFSQMTSPTPELLELRAQERRNGLDDLGERIVMIRELSPPAPPSGSTR
jgi:GNAT superfamily N-acetyltransferase